MAKDGRIFESLRSKPRKVERANVQNYSKIAKGLKIKLGPSTPSLVDQLQDTGIALSIRKSIQVHRKAIDLLYVNGYDVESLYAELIAHIQNEILLKLPF